MEGVLVIRIQTNEAVPHHKEKKRKVNDTG